MCTRLTTMAIFLTCSQAIRANGHILATNLEQGLVYDVDPHNSNAVPVVVATFGQGFVPSGIVEVGNDVFYVNNGLGDPSTFNFTPNSSSIWKLDMNTYSSTGQASISKLIDIPEARFLNGMVTASQQRGVVFTSDSLGGVIYEVDVFGPSYKVLLDHPLLKPNSTAFPQVGVNGLRIANSKLYWCNTNFGYLGTFPLSPSGALDPTPQLITNKVGAADDFDIDHQGNVWLAENVRQTLVRVSPAGVIDIIAGGINSTDLLGPVSARFGRQGDQGTLYISTDGLSFNAKRVPLTTAGKIAKINTGEWASWSH